MYSLAEQLELAFKAGAEYMRDKTNLSWSTGNGVIKRPDDSKINKAAEHYINKEALSGSLEPN